MAGVQRNIVTPPNEWLKNGDTNNGTVPLTREAGDCRPPNPMFRDGDPGNGSVSLARQGSPVQPPNHRFNVSNAAMTQPPSAQQPGKGNVPVEPFTPAGKPASAAVLRDSTRR
jgi:hypothetical protein